jgi:uncharacterized membrane protein
MDSYLLVKTLHILSATVLFGTGLGIAALMLAGHLSGDRASRLFAARMTVRADFIFTLPAVIAQAATGVWLVLAGGHVWTDRWLVLTYGLFILAGLCWLPVVWLQMRMRNMLEAEAAGRAFDAAVYRRLFRMWFALGWPAFGGLVVVIWLMVAKPSW